MGSFFKKMSEEGEEKNLSLDVTKVKPIVPPKPTSPKLNLPILSLKDNIATNEPISSPRLLLTTSEPIKSTNSKALPPEIVDVDGRTYITQGTLQHLVGALTHTEFSTNPLYIRDFLLTHKYLIDSIELINSLWERYNIEPSAGDVQEDETLETF